MPSNHMIHASSPTIPMKALHSPSIPRDEVMMLKSPVGSYGKPPAGHTPIYHPQPGPVYSKSTVMSCYGMNGYGILSKKFIFILSIHILNRYVGLYVRKSFKCVGS